MKILNLRLSTGIKHREAWLLAGLVLGLCFSLFPTSVVASSGSTQVTISPSGVTISPSGVTITPSGELPAAPVAADAVYNVKSVVVVNCNLPRNYVPSSVPARSIDETLRAALVLPVADVGPKTTWLVPTDDYSEHPVLKTGSVVTRVMLNFAEPIAGVLPRIIGRLFPHTEIIRPNADISRYELVFRVDLKSSTLPGYADHRFRGADVEGTITAKAPDGSTVSSVTASGSGDVANAGYWATHWSNESLGNSVGVPALQSMLDSLVSKLLADPSFRTYVREASARKARPSELRTVAVFDDSKGFFPNGRLDAGETARLLFKIHNVGAGPAFAVHLSITSGAKYVALPPDTEVGDLEPGAEKEISVPIIANIAVDTSVLRLPVETLEKRGYGGRPLILEIATERLQRPALEIADVSLSNRDGHSVGDGGGRPSNGETLEATVRIRNSGPGEAAGGVLTASSTLRGVDFPEATVSFPSIPPNELRLGRVLVHLPVTLEAVELPLTFDAVETRGFEVARATKTQTWPVQLKRPAVEVNFRLYDGNSAESRGDRNGIASNGEKLELVLTPENRGTLAAHDVQLSLISRQSGLTLIHNTFRVGDLPPEAEGAEVRTTMEIPRALGRDARLNNLLFAVTVTQRDFPPREQSINLAFEPRHPDLVADVTSSSPLVEGTQGVLSLELSNHGLLAAEAVQVDVSSENGALELLDAEGAPTQTVHISVGTIGAGTSVPTVPIKTHVRRNLSSGVGLLKVVAAQQDFPSFERQITTAVRKEEAAVISSVPAPPIERPVASRPVVGVNISFGDYITGQTVALETVRLRFEVQAPGNLDTVRLEENHTEVQLPPPLITSDQGIRISSYALPVHLAYGENDFEVIAVTAEGVRRNRILSIYRRQDGKLWVAAVGVSKYSDVAIPQLRFAREDAVAILDYYRNRFGLPAYQMFQLLDQEATRQNIMRTLGTELARKASNPNDTVILYFAGHGKTETDPSSPDGDGLGKFLLPYDTTASDLNSSALNMEEVKRILRRLPAERVIFIIDSCFSGAATGGRSPFDPSAARRSTLADGFLSKLADAGTGRVILTASRPWEVAEESSKYGHGIFTYFVLKGLDGAADDDANGLIDVDEIFKFVSKNMAGVTTSQVPLKYFTTAQSGAVVLGKTSMNPTTH